MRSTTMLRCTALRLNAVRCCHCTDRLLFARAADDSSSTASIDDLINLERAILQKRAHAEQRASALGGLTAVMASVTAPAGGCSPRARVAPHGRAVTETFVPLSLERASVASGAVRSATPVRGVVLHVLLACAVHGLYGREIAGPGDRASCARHDERTSTASRRPCTALMYCGCGEHLSV